MKRKQDLFDLISAMSKSEKRYFTLDAQKSGKKDSKYLELFKAINGMEDYDETKLKKKFPKNLSADKAYLYDAILRSMRDYRSAKSISAQIKEMILDAKYLYERGLYDQSEDRLIDAKELAKSIDDQVTLLEINREERALAWLIKKNYENKFQELVIENKTSITDLLNYFRYYDLSSELIIGLNKGYYKDKNSLVNELEEKIDFNLELKSPRAKQKYYLTLALYYQNLNELERAATYYAMIIDIWEENIDYKREEPFRYIDDINGLLSVYTKLGKIEEWPTLIKKLEEESSANTHLKGATFYIVNIYKLIYLINTGEKHDVKSLVDEIEVGLASYKMNAPRQIALMFNATVLLFVNEKFQLSNEWSKKLIKKMKMVHQKTGLWPSYFLRLLSVQEFMDREVLDNEIRNIERLFSSEMGKKEETIMLKLFQLIKDYINAPILEINSKLTELKIFIESQQNKPEKTNLPQGIDELILLWVNSKLSRRNMTTITIEARKKKLKKKELNEVG